MNGSVGSNDRPSIGGRVWEQASTRLARRRRGLQIALGLIWLLDAGLQYQPFMFKRDFVTDVLIGSAAGTPGVVKHPIVSVGHLVLHHSAVWNSGFATLQLLIAIGLLWRPTVRVALATSIGWSMLVWWFGEGFGGVFTGATPVMGYPGAVLLYALIAVLVWPTIHAGSSVATSGPLRDGPARAVWLVLWASFVRFLLLAANRSPQGLNVAVAEMGVGEPQWEKSIDASLARALAHHGTQVSIVLALLCAVVAIGVFVPALLRPALVLAMITALAFWVAQDFGGLFTSQGTDPNSGPLLVLLALCFWPIGARGRVGPVRDQASSIRGPATP